MLKKLTLSVATGLVAIGLCSQVLADSFTWNIVGPMSTNVLPAPMKITSLSILATNTVTVAFYDSPNTALTNMTSAYTNYVKYATNFNSTWTNFYGAVNTNYFTNVLVTVTNSSPAATNFYLPVGTWTALSNTTVNVPNLSGMFNNGVVISNSTANTATITIGYTGN